MIPYFAVFHLMLATDAVLVPTLYGNYERQDCMGFGNTEWLTESFNCLDSMQLEV